MQQHRERPSTDQRCRAANVGSSARARSQVVGRFDFSYSFVHFGHPLICLRAEGQAFGRQPDAEAVGSRTRSSSQLRVAANTRSFVARALCAVTAPAAATPRGDEVRFQKSGALSFVLCSSPPPRPALSVQVLEQLVTRVKVTCNCLLSIICQRSYSELQFLCSTRSRFQPVLGGSLHMRGM